MFTKSQDISWINHYYHQQPHGQLTLSCIFETLADNTEINIKLAALSMHSTCTNIMCAI
ncbi:hypothetical protein HanXRQr2_Chr12g0562201 [Helianthus annuus]|uniref:Uncharacterized protein n=1 Tax=Helianthus annuus TaxID=4232 RepID=A0A9K3MYA5_HELAN|nr:hypothetical protein HanXRQr2_Chr12g0562201 [Helianthus annuus]KAJ0864410.1 hypothetical protein HanPSC8_Chr12g0541671 [Helianthus annuus]